MSCFFHHFILFFPLLISPLFLYPQLMLFYFDGELLIMIIIRQPFPLSLVPAIIPFSWHLLAKLILFFFYSSLGLFFTRLRSLDEFFIATVFHFRLRMSGFQVRICGCSSAKNLKKNKKKEVLKLTITICG